MDERRLRKSPNLAIVGSTSLLGKELRQILEDGAFPMGRLALLETEEYAGLLQEFAGEIQITQVISPDVFNDIDIAFFTCSVEIMQAYMMSGSRFPDLTIDLTQAGPEGTMYLQGISDPRVLKSRGRFVNPHPASIVIAQLLSKLHKAFDMRSAAVTVLEPASERGSAGVDELQEQTVNLLNFQQTESKVFEGQLAFNVRSEPDASEKTEKRLLDQVTTILGPTFPLPMITVVQAPVFHSHAFSFFVNLLGNPSAEEIVQRLHDGGATMSVDDRPGGPSPVSVVGADVMHIGRVSHDKNHLGSYSIWVVADNLRIAAWNAIHIAESIMLAPALDA